MVLVAAATAIFTLLPAFAASASAAGHSQQRTVADVEYLGVDEFEPGTIFDDTTIGGLSSITYDRSRRTYYTLSDDQAVVDPVR